jgi:hypothetical protein
MVIVLLVADTLSHGLWPHQPAQSAVFCALGNIFRGDRDRHVIIVRRGSQADQRLTFCTPLAPQLLCHDAMWKRTFRAVTGPVPASTAPWYRRADVWLLLGAIVLPFGWILALGRMAWVTAAARRER